MPTCPHRAASAPIVEELESRICRSVSLAGGLLTVKGTDGKDKIIVSLEAKHPTKLDVTVNGTTTVYKLSAVTSLFINGGAGNDLIFVGQTGPSLTRATRIYGGPGNDTIFGANGNDRIDGGSGNDIITAGSGQDTITGGPGRDSVMAGSGADYIDGGSSSDTIRGGAGHDTILGGDGNDTLYAGTGGDTIDGGAGTDHISSTGGLGNLIHGGADDDVLSGGVLDTIFGDSGDDHFLGITTGVQDLSPEDNQGAIPCGCA